MSWAGAERIARLEQALSQRLGRVHVALEALYHRHNVSAILRTCDALGLHHVHLVEGHFRPAKGASRGAERWLSLQQHRTQEQALQAIAAAGCSLWVADLDEHSVLPEEVPVDRPVCLWFGAELVGVGPVARAAADGVVGLPMHGLSQSLNVSVAAALTLRPVAERARALGQAALLSPAEQEQTMARWRAREEEVIAQAVARSRSR